MWVELGLHLVLARELYGLASLLHLKYSLPNSLKMWWQISISESFKCCHLLAIALSPSQLLSSSLSSHQPLSPSFLTSEPSTLLWLIPTTVYVNSYAAHRIEQLLPLAIQGVRFRQPYRIGCACCDYSSDHVVQQHSLMLFIYSFLYAPFIIQIEYVRHQGGASSCQSQLCRFRSRFLLTLFSKNA